MRHQESDGVAMRAASEAVVELLGRAHREGRRLFVVERTEPEVIHARFLQLHVARNHVDDVDAYQKILLERLGDQAEKKGDVPHFPLNKGGVATFLSKWSTSPGC